MGTATSGALMPVRRIRAADLDLGESLAVHSEASISPRGIPFRSSAAPRPAPGLSGARPGPASGASRSNGHGGSPSKARGRATPWRSPTAGRSETASGEARGSSRSSGHRVDPEQGLGERCRPPGPGPAGAPAGPASGAARPGGGAGESCRGSPSATRCSCPGLVAGGGAKAASGGSGGSGAARQGGPERRPDLGSGRFRVVPSSCCQDHGGERGAAGTRPAGRSAPAQNGFRARDPRRLPQ